MRGKVAVVCNDAGGAEILSSWLCRYTIPFCLVLDGPAKEIFNRKLENCNPIALSEAIKQCDWVLCGSSWQATLERRAIAEARQAGKKVIVFLDHWSNYERRFRVADTLVLPDEIWVGDTEAKNLAKNCFPNIPIVQQVNPYFLDLQEALQSTEPRSGKKIADCAILYVCEPTGERALKKYGDARYLTGYTEEDALHYFLDNIQVLGRKRPLVTLRPHPAEAAGKYDWVSEASNVKIIYGGDTTLVQEIVEADVVAGCSSMALVVGLLANKRVICCIPPGGKPFSLPYPEIEHLQLLVDAFRGAPDA